MIRLRKRGIIIHSLRAGYQNKSCAVLNLKVGSTSIMIKQSEEDFMWTTLASEEIIKRTIEALRGRGVRVEFLKKKHYLIERLL